MKRINRTVILLSCVLCFALMFACSQQKEEDDGMKTYITFRNSNPGSWEGEKSEASTMIGIMDEDGSNLRYIDTEKMGIEGQNTWGPCGDIVVDGKIQMLLSSSEGGMGHLATTRYNLWIYDFETKEITQIYNNKEDRADLISLVHQFADNRFMFFERVGQDVCKYYITDLDGGNSEEIEFITHEGYLYPPRVTPDEKLFIIQHSNPYSLWKCGIEGGELELLAWDPAGLSFSPAISNDSKWLAYTFVEPRKDPLHEWADVYIVNIETKEKVQLIDDKSYWLTGYHGDETIRGGGSNLLCIAPFGNYVTIVKGLENSKSPWKEETVDNPDNHFNKEYDESIASGGTGISLIDMYTGEEIVITEAVEGNWDFRPAWNKKTNQLLFTRAKTGGKPEIWMCDSDGSNQKLITKGYNDVGADQPVWIQ